RRNPMKSDELGWSRFTVSVNSAGAGWVAGGDTLRVPRRQAWVPSARRSEAVDQAPRPSVSPSGSGLIAAERDGLHLSRNGSSAPLLRFNQPNDDMLTRITRNGNEVSFRTPWCFTACSSRVVTARSGHFEYHPF